MSNYLVYGFCVVALLVMGVVVSIEVDMLRRPCSDRFLQVANFIIAVDKDCQMLGFVTLFGAIFIIVLLLAASVIFEQVHRAKALEFSIPRRKL